MSKMTKFYVEQNLKTAQRAIRESMTALAKAASSNAEHELRDALWRAKEVRTVFSLLLLRFEAEEFASELLELQKRRNELIASLRAYTTVTLAMGEQVRSAFESRLVSGAISIAEDLQSSVSPTPENARYWQTRLQAIERDEPETEESDGNSD